MVVDNLLREGTFWFKEENDDIQLREKYIEQLFKEGKKDSYHSLSLVNAVKEGKKWCSVIISRERLLRYSDKYNSASDEEEGDTPVCKELSAKLEEKLLGRVTLIVEGYGEGTSTDEVKRMLAGWANEEPSYFKELEGGKRIEIAFRHFREMKKVIRLFLKRQRE